MMHPTGIGPSPNLVPQDVSIRNLELALDNAGLNPKAPFESKGLQDGNRYISDAPVSTHKQLAQRMADQSAATPGAGAPSAGQEQPAPKHPQSGGGGGKQSGDSLNPFMKFLQSIDEAFGNIGRMFMGGFGSVSNMAMSLFSLAANSVRSMIRI